MFEDADLNRTDACANTHPVLKKEEEMITIENRQMLIPRGEEIIGTSADQSV